MARHAPANHGTAGGVEPYALRGLAKNGGQAPEPYIGFGDPDLKGRRRRR
jgi:hypothetical protein